MNLKTKLAELFMLRGSDAVLTSSLQGSRYVYAIVNKNTDKSRELALDFDGIWIKTPKMVKATVLNGSSATIMI